MKKVFTILTVCISLGCAHSYKPKETLITESFTTAEKQLEKQTDRLNPTDGYPRRLSTQGELITTYLNDWTEGFFPGCLWYMYEYTGRECWKQQALKWTLPLEKLQHLTSHHDIGFLMYCSYGNAYRLTGEEKFKDILIESAKSLCSRFNPVTGCIQSWNYRESWDKQHKWYFPVIIDNMMNLELLYAATELTGDSSFAAIANIHAETTARHHFRDDYSSYHVVNYNPTNGQVEFRGTCQGFSDNSTWARGQAWAIYGYTMAYRFTGKRHFLELAEKLTGFWINHPRLPKDGVPYWDFNAGETGFTPADWAKGRTLYTPIPRDASAAAITCSALFELYEHTKNPLYYRQAEKTLQSLSSPAYQASIGTNGYFILMHSVGSLPHQTEIDVPIIYADYYYLEALLRYNRLIF